MEKKYRFKLNQLEKRKSIVHSFYNEENQGEFSNLLEPLLPTSRVEKQLICQRRIQNLVKHIRWSVWRKWLTANRGLTRF